MGQNKLYCTLTDGELSAKAQYWIDRLIKSGGKDFTMQVPARPNEDTDLILAELEQRFLKYCYENAALQAKCERYESLLQAVLQKAKEGIFPHLPVETMGAQKCIEIDAMLNEAISAGEGEKENNNG
jgi:hypothetical protein